jgi:hypothetical protein
MKEIPPNIPIFFGVYLPTPELYRQVLSLGKRMHVYMCPSPAEPIEAAAPGAYRTRQVVSKWSYEEIIFGIFCLSEL